MNDYPIEGLMNSAMNSIKEMIDVDTIIGEPIETSSNVVIIPVSRVNFGFAAGGSEFRTKSNVKTKEEKEEKEETDKKRLPFGGGSGAGVSISPIAFIVVQESGVKLLPVEHTSAVDKLLDLVPDLIDKTTQIMDKKLKKMEKNSPESIVVKVSEGGNSNKPMQNANDNKNVNSTSKNKTNNEPSTVVKVESKPYDIEYDETDM